MNIIISAAQFARRAHEGQVRDFHRVPYIFHPARVAGRVALHPDATEVMVAAAFLHDVVEDTPFNLQDVATATSFEVSDLVSQLTNPSKNMKLPREDRKAIDRAHLRKATREAKIIKMIDRIDNLRDMDGADDQFRQLYAGESLLLAETVGDADSALKAELVEICRKMQEDA
jgi:(p)ppGpp synthase/HD superfamily hydrolase